jgi:hypothetical protein
MTVKRAALAVLLGTTLGSGYALWDERDRGEPAKASTVAASAPTPAPAIAADRAPEPSAAVAAGAKAALLTADAGATAPPAAPANPARDRLIADLERAKLEQPAELEQLLRLQQKGAKPRTLRSYVRKSFPRDTRLRLVVGRWIKSLEPTRAARQASARRHKRG